MGNPKIYATGNETLKGEFNISYYIFEKDINFLDWLGRLLTEVFEIENGEQQAKYIINTIENDDEEIVEEKIYIKNVKKMVDIHEKYFSKGIIDNTGDRIDVFYGKDRIYVTLRTSRKTRKKFGTFVRKTRDWVNIEEIQKIPVYVSERKKTL